MPDSCHGEGEKVSSRCRWGKDESQKGYISYFIHFNTINPQKTETSQIMDLNRETTIFSFRDTDFNPSELEFIDG